MFKKIVTGLFVFFIICAHSLLAQTSSALTQNDFLLIEIITAVSLFLSIIMLAVLLVLYYKQSKGVKLMYENLEGKIKSLILDFEELKKSFSGMNDAILPKIQNLHDETKKILGEELKPMLCSLSKSLEEDITLDQEIKLKIDNILTQVDQLSKSYQSLSDKMDSFSKDLKSESEKVLQSEVKTKVEIDEKISILNLPISSELQKIEEKIDELFLKIDAFSSKNASSIIQTPSPQISKVKPLSDYPSSLPNATVGKEYNVDILKILSEPNAFDVSVIIPNELTGLSFTQSNSLISGVPAVSGDFKLKLKFKHKNQIAQERYLEKMLLLIINPDPKSLWKNLPCDKNDPYWKEDFSSKIMHKEKIMMAASARGRSHAQEGKFRDDAFKLDYLDDGWYLLAVADGAGSAKYSRRGSEIACDIGFKTLIDKIGKMQADVFEAKVKEYLVSKNDPKLYKNISDISYDVMGGVAFSAYQAIKEEAAKKIDSDNKPALIKDFATTFIVSAVKKFDFGWFIMSYWIGDGGIGIFKKGDSVKLLGEPDGGEFAGQTRFLTMSDIWEPTEILRRIKFEICDDFTALILMTDGITDPKLETENNLKDISKWDLLWKDIETEVNFDRKNINADKELLKWLEFWSAGNHDDRTIAILY